MKPTTESANMVKHLCKVEREKYSRKCDSSESTSTIMLLIQILWLNVCSCSIDGNVEGHFFKPNYQELLWLLCCMNWVKDYLWGHS